MLDTSLVAMFLIYVGVGLSGYITYGWLQPDGPIDVLITTNMAADQHGIVPLELPGKVSTSGTG